MTRIIHAGSGIGPAFPSVYKSRQLPIGFLLNFAGPKRLPATALTLPIFLPLATAGRHYSHHMVDHGNPEGGKGVGSREVVVIDEVQLQRRESWIRGYGPQNKMIITIQKSFSILDDYYHPKIMLHYYLLSKKAHLFSTSSNND